MISILSLFLVLQGLQPGTGIVTGSVRFEAGGSAAGVRVAALPVDDPTGTNFLSIAETDGAGRYRLSNVPASRYYIVAGRVTNLTYYPGGNDKARAAAVTVESARISPNVNLTVPADSKRIVINPPQYFPPAGSSEWTAYQGILNEKDAGKKMKLQLDFEKNFPRSPQLSAVYTGLMEMYIATLDEPNASAYGVKALKVDPNNVTALVLMSRKHALLDNDLAAALRYAERAMDAVAKAKTVPPQFVSDKQVWQNWVSSLDANAKSNLAWVKNLQAVRERTILAVAKSKR